MPIRIHAEFVQAAWLAFPQVGIAWLLGTCGYELRVTSCARSGRRIASIQEHLIDRIVRDVRTNMVVGVCFWQRLMNNRNTLATGLTRAVGDL